VLARQLWVFALVTDGMGPQARPPQEHWVTRIYNFIVDRDEEEADKSLSPISTCDSKRYDARSAAEAGHSLSC